MIVSKKSVERQRRFLYDRNIWLAVLSFALPSIILGLMTGMFIFVDQLMMVKIVPQHLSTTQIWGNSLLAKYQILLNGQYGSLLLSPDTSDIVRTSVVYGAPITIVINATALLVGNGAGVNYNYYNGKKDFISAKKTWVTGFWCNFFIGIMLVVIICASCNAFVKFEQGNSIASKLAELEKKGMSQADINTVSSFYNTYFSYVNKFCQQFLYTVGAGSIFAITSSFMTLLVIAEGKQLVVILFSVICNIINILLDFLLLKYAKLNTIAGGIATTTGWFLNTALCFMYVYYLNKKDDTNLMLKELKNFSFNIKWYLALCKPGLCSFLRNLSIAVTITLQVYLVISATKNGAEYQTIYGAVNPVVNLLFTAAFSSTNGARTVSAYNYGANNWARVKKSYICLTLIMICWALFVFTAFGIGLNSQILYLFSVSSHLSHAARYVLMINIGASLPIGLTITSMMLFQSTKKQTFACINGLMYGVICYVPLVFLLRFIAQQTNNEWVFVASPVIIASFAAIICNVWSIFYLRKHCHILTKKTKLLK